MTESKHLKQRLASAEGAEETPEFEVSRRCAGTRSSGAADEDMSAAELASRGQVAVVVEQAAALGLRVRLVEL